jgi:hypothetical protein
LTPALREKLYDDIQTAVEIMLMFTDYLFGGLDQPVEPPLLHEILPNILEITRRTADLEGMIRDPGLSAAVTAVHELSLCCQLCMTEYKKRRFFDVARLRASLDNALRACAAKSVIPTGEEKSSQTKRRRIETDDISVQEFFEKFDEMRGVVTAPVPHTDSLIDLF